MTTRIRILALALLLTGAAACGSSSSGGSTAGAGSGSGSSASSAHTVTMHNFAFNPPTITVKAGTKVTFVNHDSAPHNATATSGSAFKTPTLRPGQTYTVTFSKPGTYAYTCTIHPYMHGTVIVK